MQLLASRDYPVIDYQTMGESIGRERRAMDCSLEHKQFNRSAQVFPRKAGIALALFLAGTHIGK